MELTVSEMIQFIQGVEQYYNNAWTKLIIVGGLIVGAGAILLPIVIQLWQKKQLNIQSENIKMELEKKLDDMFKSKFELYTTEYEKKFAELANGITKVQDEASGYISHMRGGIFLDKKFFSPAIGSYLKAAERYISIGEDSNLQGILDTLSEQIFPKLTDCDVIEEYEKDINKLLSSLEKANVNGQYTNYIRNLKKAFKATKKRLEPGNIKKKEG